MKVSKQSVKEDSVSDSTLVFSESRTHEELLFRHRCRTSTLR